MYRPSDRIGVVPRRAIPHTRSEFAPRLSPLSGTRPWTRPDRTGVVKEESPYGHPKEGTQAVDGPVGEGAWIPAVNSNRRGPALRARRNRRRRFDLDCYGVSFDGEIGDPKAGAVEKELGTGHGGGSCQRTQQRAKRAVILTNALHQFRGGAPFRCRLPYGINIGRKAEHGTRRERNLEGRRGACDPHRHDGGATGRFGARLGCQGPTPLVKAGTESPSAEQNCATVRSEDRNRSIRSAHLCRVAAGSRRVARIGTTASLIEEPSGRTGTNP